MQSRAKGEEAAIFQHGQQERGACVDAEREETRQKNERSAGGRGGVGGGPPIRIICSASHLCSQHGEYQLCLKPGCTSFSDNPENFTRVDSKTAGRRPTSHDVPSDKVHISTCHRSCCITVNRNLGCVFSRGHEQSGRLPLRRRVGYPRHHRLHLHSQRQRDNPKTNIRLCFPESTHYPRPLYLLPLLTANRNRVLHLRAQNRLITRASVVDTRQGLGRSAYDADSYNISRWWVVYRACTLPCDKCLVDTAWIVT
jgi:hypothetical protein